MKNKDVEQLLFSAFADAVPNRANAVAEKAKDKGSGAIMSVSQENYRKKYLHYAALTAAMIVLAVGIILTVVTVRSREVYGTVTVEGVECVEITVGRGGRPISLIAHDSSSTKVTRYARKDYHTMGEAIDCVLDSMLEVGGLDDEHNTVLFTVEADPETAHDQFREVMESARDSFDASGFDGAILGTVASNEPDVVDISRRNSVTLGKAEMVFDISNAIPSFNTAGLCRLSVNELNLISWYRTVSYAAIASYGYPHGIISPEESARLALSFIDDPTATAQAVLGYNDGGLVYTVTVTSQEEEIYYRLSAFSGDVLGSSRHIEALMQSENDPSEMIAVTQSAENETTGTLPTEYRPTAVQETLPSAPTSAIAPTTAPRPTTAPKPTAVQTAPTAPSHTAVPEPTAAPKPAEPDVFSRSSYYRYSAGKYGSEILPETAKQVSVRRALNGYDTYYDADTFPYSAQGTQGGITALVFNTTQFRSLTGTDDSRFDGAYFKTHALYIYMNRDVSYRWTKKINSAYVDGSVLYIENAESIGRYVGDSETGIHTVIYELNKDDLRSFTNMLEFTDQKGEPN